MIAPFSLYKIVFYIYFNYNHIIGKSPKIIM